MSRTLSLAVLAAVLGCLAAEPCSAQPYDILHAFADWPTGPSRPIQGSDGKLYGTTGGGGSGSVGTVWRLEDDGRLALLHEFTFGGDGAFPASGLVGVGGVLYGTTTQSNRVGIAARGGGTVFRINEDGTGFQTVYRSQHGWQASLFAMDGVLFGITWDGAGRVFRLDLDGRGFTVLHEFSGPDGATPSSLTGRDGVLYGTTSRGGGDPRPDRQPLEGDGTIFRLNADGSGFAVLHRFAGGEGGSEPAHLVLDDGVLYGASGMQHSGDRRMFRLGTNGRGFKVIRLFEGSGGAPSGFVIVDGTLYGTYTRRPGAVPQPGPSREVRSVLYAMKPDGSELEELAEFEKPVPLAVSFAAEGWLHGMFHSALVRVELKARKDEKRVPELLYDFVPRDGSHATRLVRANGVLYGVTASGGPASRGAVFRMNEDGSGYAPLHFFQGEDGATPLDLVESGGTLFGTAWFGGAVNKGTVFRLQVDGSAFAVLHEFGGPDGEQPTSLAVADGVLYGTTRKSDGGFGTVWRLHPNGTGFAVLKHFLGGDGDTPTAIAAAEGRLYGTTASMGGTVYTMGCDGWGFRVLHRFGILDGVTPQGAIAVAGGRVFGTTLESGREGPGIVYSIETTGRDFKVLHRFTPADGVQPLDIVHSDGVLYGVTRPLGPSGGGTIYGLTDTGAGFTTLQHLDRATGFGERVTLLAAGETFYGTTWSAGPRGGGTAFRLRPPIITLSHRRLDLRPPAGTASYTVSGENLTGAIVITPSSRLELSQDGLAGPYGAGQSLDAGGGSVRPTVIDVRVGEGILEDEVTGQLVHSSPGAVTRVLTAGPETR